MTQFASNGSFPIPRPKQETQTDQNLWDVIIIGAGPAGLFAAYELTENKPGIRVLIIEQGKQLSERLKTDTVSGVGGSGTYSDGKLYTRVHDPRVPEVLELLAAVKEL